MEDEISNRNMPTTVGELPAQVKLVDQPKMLKCTRCKRKSPRTEVLVLSR